MAGAPSLALSLVPGGVAPASSTHELEAKAELLDLILAATNDGIVDIDLLSGESHYSPRWKYLLGFDDEDMPPGTEHANLWRALVHPDDTDRVEGLLADHIEQNWPLATTIR